MNGIIWFVVGLIVGAVGFHQFTRFYPQESQSLLNKARDFDDAVRDRVADYEKTANEKIVELEAELRAAREKIREYMNKQ